MRFPVRIMTLSALFAVLTALGAFIRIPFPLVPITLQTFFVFLSGTLLGSRAGALAQVLYVGMGLIGLPVFTGGGGPSTFSIPPSAICWALSPGPGPSVSYPKGPGSPPSPCT